MFLDYAEMQAKSQKTIFMSDWITKLIAFLEFNEKPVLKSYGTCTRVQAVRYSTQQLEVYRQKQKQLEKEQSKQEYIEDIKELDEILKNNKN